MEKVETKPILGRLPQFAKFIILLIMGAGIVYAYKHFEDAYEKVNGKWKEKTNFREKIDDKIKSFDDCEVYYLLALSDGLYECYNCQEGLFFLFFNEIVKIGMTCTGEDRYHQSFYGANNVRYQVVFTGNSLDCQQEEIRRLGEYAKLPQNMSRPDPSEISRKNKRYKLLYPVLNTSLK